MLKRIFFVSVFCSVLWASCTKETSAPAIDLQSEFFPLKVGSVLIYDVDSTAYSNFTGGNINYKFELKDSVADTYTDLTGAVNYRVERYKRTNLNSPWVIHQVYSRNKSLRAAEEFMGNQRFIRLIFPPVRGAYWNGNSKNNIGKQEYLIEEDILSFTVNSLTFDSTVTVKEIDEFNLIKEDLVKSTYAKHVGLVQKTVVDIEKNISTGKTTDGRVYSLKLKSYQ